MAPLLGRATLVGLAVGLLMLPFGASARADGQNYTDLPELQGAAVVSMRTEVGSSDTRPAGMTIALRFDEPLVSGILDPSDFVVYGRSGVARHASTAQLATDTVTAFFPDVDTRAKATSLTLAVVEEGAVSNSNGGGNPIGTSPIARRKKYHGSKSCIRLIRANHLRHVRDRTLVNFTFTSFASCDTWASGASVQIKAKRLHLEMTDGRSIPALRVRHGAIDPTSTDQVTLKAVFPGKRIGRHIGRITARDAAVYYSWWGAGSDDSGFEYNWLQARAMSHAGRTAQPDLVSVTLHPSSDPQLPGHATFAFDQRVEDPLANRFSVDRLRGVHAVVVPHHPRRVRVSFSPVYANVVADATDGSVRYAAVEGARADEVPIPNTVTYSTMTDGLTIGPDMTSGVYLTQSGGVVASFRFDAELSGEPVPSGFHLYGKDGTKYDAEQCELMSVRSTWYPDHVRCTFTEAARVPTDETQLATVDASAVQDTQGRANPVGEAPTYAPSVTPWSRTG